MTTKIKMSSLRGRRPRQSQIHRIASLTLAMTLLATSVPLVSAASYDQAKAVAYLKAGSGDDWAVIALGVANSTSGMGLDFLKADPGGKPTDIEKRILAMTAAGKNPETFGQINLIQKLLTFWNGTEIVSPSDPNLLSDDVFGLLSFVAAGKNPEVRSQLASFIKQNQNADGGFSHFKKGQSNSDYTAMATYALIAHGEPQNSPAVNRAFEFLATTKKTSGWSHFPSGSADAYTTSWVIPSLRAAGRDIPQSAIDFLINFQGANGSFDNSPLLTAYAVIALNGLNSGSNPSLNHQITVKGPGGLIFEGQINSNTALTALGALDLASKQGGFSYVTKNTSLGIFVESIAGIGPQGEQGWMYAVNFVKPSVSAASYNLSNNDAVIWFYGLPNDQPPSGNQGGNNQGSLGLSANIINTEPAPTLSLEASKTNIKIGQSLVLTWSSSNAARVANSSPNNWAGNILAGSIVIQPSQTTIYSLTVEGPGGTAEKSVTINVSQAPSIVFGIDKTSVDFGNLKKGETSALQSIRVTNQGNVEIKITGQLQNADALYNQGLYMNGILWENYQTSLSPNFAKTMNLKLAIPANYEGTGRKNGTLILWAFPK